MSEKVKRELTVWLNIKKERINAIVSQYGYLKCEHCDKAILLSPSDAHHLDMDRRNNTLSNCRIVHRYCHSFIHDNNTKDVPSLLREGE